jgi:hypothetical protein
LKKVNLTKVRELSAIGCILAAVVLAGASVAAPPAEAESEPRVTVALLPNGYQEERLAELPGLALGLLSPAIGRVDASQTYLDITQGNRVSDSLYDRELPPVLPSSSRGIEPGLWRLVERRAAQAPAEVVPGLLASSLIAAGVPVTAAPGEGGAAVIAADREGRIPFRDPAGCPPRGCPGLSVDSVQPYELPGLVRRLRDGDLLIAIEAPPPEERLLTLGVAGEGFEGLLTSDSTRITGLVTSTDLAPTILERLGVPVPDEMNGEPIRAEGELDIDELSDLDGRMELTSKRRGPVVGQNLLVWLALVALASLIWRRPGARVALPLLALAGAYLPLLTLVTAALEPSLLAERLIVGAGAPLLAAVTLALVPGWAALAVPCLATVAAYAIDLLAGTALIPLSIPGPNPAAGSRFYGIGNEIEAIVAALLPLGVGAALASAGATRDGGRTAALAFLAAGLIAAAIFAAGRFGADVGAAIVIPAAMAVGAAVALRSRRGTALVLLAPLAGLAALALVDVVAGGGAHLTRSVLEAGGLEEAGDVIERRVRLAGQSFERGDNVPYIGIAVALGGLFAWRRRQVLGWFTERSALAGFAGAGAAAVIGTVSNDSGAILLILIGAYLAAAAGFAWALQGPRSRPRVTGHQAG